MNFEPSLIKRVFVLSSCTGETSYYLQNISTGPAWCCITAISSRLQVQASHWQPLTTTGRSTQWWF